MLPVKRKSTPGVFLCYDFLEKRKQYTFKLYYTEKKCSHFFANFPSIFLILSYKTNLRTDTLPNYVTTTMSHIINNNCERNLEFFVHATCTNAHWLTKTATNRTGESKTWGVNLSERMWKVETSKRQGWASTLSKFPFPVHSNRVQSSKPLKHQNQTQKHTHTHFLSCSFWRELKHEKRGNGKEGSCFFHIVNVRQSRISILSVHYTLKTKLTWLPPSSTTTCIF